MEHTARRLIQVGAVQGNAHKQVVRLERRQAAQVSLHACIADCRYQRKDRPQGHLPIALQVHSIELSSCAFFAATEESAGAYNRRMPNIRANETGVQCAAAVTALTPVVYVPQGLRRKPAASAVAPWGGVQKAPGT